MLYSVNEVQWDWALYLPCPKNEILLNFAGITCKELSIESYRYYGSERLYEGWENNVRESRPKQSRNRRQVHWQFMS